MNFTNTIRNWLIKLTGYYIFKKKYLPIGTDLLEDINTKINIEIKTIFDVGANIGQSTLLYSKVFPKANIMSFEPISYTFKDLERNTEKLKNVTLFQFAFGEKMGMAEVKLFDESKSALNSLKHGSMNSENAAKIEVVEVNTIDEFLKKNPEIKNIDLLKIDTEGFEIQVLTGAISALKSGRIKLVFLEVGFSKFNLRSTYISEFHDFFDSNNFSFFGLYDMSIQRIGDKYHYANVLFIHDSITTNHLVQ